MINGIETNDLGKSAQEEMAPSEIRIALIDKFQDNLQQLQPKIVENRSRETLGKKPLVAVVVSLFEEDDSMLTTKMFSKSLWNLLSQAKSSGMDLDFIVAANNGGGRTEEIGSSMVVILRQLLSSKFGAANFHLVNTNMPDESDNPVIPWKVEVPLSESRIEGQDRCFLIVQPFNKVNAGKVRALRDVTSALHSEILRGYTPDAIFQMDAETILEYQKTHLKLLKSPFRAMYDALKRRDGVVAIGTKDRFEPIDPGTGKPLGLPRPIAQEGFMQINTGKRENFISLPGGAILAEPHYYVAGMEAVPTTTPGDIAEDYLFTQILREYAKNNDMGEIVKVNSLNVITHLNRCPQGYNAIRQLLRWKRQGAAVDQIFPDSKYQYKPLINYIILTIKSRLREGIRNKSAYLSQLINDIRDIPGALEIIRNTDVADILNGKANWAHSSKN